MKHILSLFAFEATAILPVVLVFYGVQQFEGGLSWETGNANKFNYHPIFMVIGLVFVMGHALISFRILPLGHRVKKYIHATLNIVAAVFSLIGLAAVIQYHNEAGIPNFYSLHSWCGISLISLLLLQALAGLTIFQDLFRGASDDLRGTYKPFHVVLGISMVTLTAACIISGVQEKYGFSNPEKYSAHAYAFNFLGLSIFLWVFTVIYILIAVEKRSPMGEYDPLINGSRENSQVESVN